MAWEVIESLMLSLQDEEQKVNLSRFFKTGPGQYGEGDRFLGIKVPCTREIVRQHWKQCTLQDVERLIGSEYHEIRFCALLILVKMVAASKTNPENFDRIVEFYLGHTAYINNWDLVDLSCYEILGRYLQGRDRSILYNLARNGRTIWEQRIGIVSTMAFVRNGDYSTTLEIADILLHHEHDLIRKAVGWLLREVGERDGLLLRSFLLSRYRSMPRTMLRYAVEKFPEEERQKYLKGEIQL